MKLDITISTNPNCLANLVGVNDCNLKLFKTYLNCNVSIFNNEIVTDATNEKFELLTKIFQILVKIVDNNIALTKRDVVYIINLAIKNKLDGVLDIYLNRKKVFVTNRGVSIYPKTFNQQKYFEYLKSNQLIFGIGPAGTGKTYLAVAYGVSLLKNNDVKKIVITRPVVEAGESLGFLPGDLKEKVDPYLIPIYDCLHEFLGKENTDNLIEKNIIEIAPLAYMRGRTLENCFVLLDEAQNTTSMQMKMFLTRLGFNSKMVITGDLTQVDLKPNIQSGLKIAVSKLRDIEDIKVLEFDKIDVVRNPLVAKIIERYEENGN